ncbi:MAG: response regulator transcription factor [Actinobacteria bacterium]|nr:response regulator transcription factor [Actinomycetota bacterium]
MTGVVVCHGTASIRERIVVTSLGVPLLAPVRAAASADELVTLARRLAPTVVLMDADLPAPGPAEAMRRLRAIAPAATVVMLAGPDDAAALERALALGARGFLTPDVNRSELAAVAAHVHIALANGAVGGRDERPETGPPMVEDGAVPPAPSAPVAPLAPLTRRELEVLVGMSNGRSNGQIGQDLYLSEDTVKTHARRLFRKLGASDRAQAVAIGMRRGLIH